MKCKRCLTQVSDDVEVCPNCGQDLMSLRELLKNFYEEQRPQRPEEPPSISFPEEKEIDLSQDLADEIALSEESERVEIMGGNLRTERETEIAEAFVPPPVPRGGFWRRLLAFGIDQVILLLTLVLFLSIGFIALQIGSGRETGLSFSQQVRLIFPFILPLAGSLALAYFTYFHGVWGQTIGKMIFGLQVLRTDGQELALSGALARTLAYPISTLPFFLGFLWVGLTRQKRAWHDRIAGTVVLRQRARKRDLTDRPGRL